MVEAFGGRTIRGEPIHGKDAEVEHDGTGIYAGLPEPPARRPLPLADRRPRAARGARANAPPSDGIVMGVRHRSLPAEGVQFHPESVLTPEGNGVARQLPGGLNNCGHVGGARGARMVASVDFVSRIGDFLDTIADGTAEHSEATWPRRLRRGAARAGVARVHRTPFRLYRGVYSAAIPSLLTDRGPLARGGIVRCGPVPPCGAGPQRRIWGCARNRAARLRSSSRSTAGRIRRPGLSIHRSTSLVSADVTEVDGIPTTTPRRTLADLRRVLSDEASAPPSAAPRSLRLDTGPQSEYAPDRSRNELERALFAVCRAERLPLPERTLWIGRVRGRLPSA